MTSLFKSCAPAIQQDNLPLRAKLICSVGARTSALTSRYCYGFVIAPSHQCPQNCETAVAAPASRLSLRQPRCIVDSSTLSWPTKALTSSAAVLHSSPHAHGAACTRQCPARFLCF